MKKRFLLTPCFLVCMLFFGIAAHTQNPVNWTEDQLMQPPALAGIITNHTDSVVIISVGPFSSIPGSIHVGMTSEQEALAKLKTLLGSIKKEQKIVIYCGCCPFERCPNVRPAMAVLKEMKFTSYYLLNLPDNLRINWMDKGYPTINL